MLTFLPLEEIDELAKLQGSELNKAKEILAYEVTNLIHGKEEADKAQETAKALFGNKANLENMPTTVLNDQDFTDGNIGVLALLCKLGLTSSNGEARRLVTQGGISIDDVKITDPKAVVTKEAVADGVIVKKGKKIFHKATL